MNRRFRRHTKAMALAAGASLAAITCIFLAPVNATEPPQPSAIVETYSNIAAAMYADSAAAARALQEKVAELVANPTAASLEEARTAWKAARVPYQQSEGLRFGNPAVDDWEGAVNAWPLDEGLIDYTAESYGTESDENPLYTANVIANPKLQLGEETLDATAITPALLDKLHVALDVEANVASGYHAIEFLLWGQDLNGTGKGAGARPATDFDPKACTGGNCDRRAQYLTAATQHLTAKLDEMVTAWQPGGAARVTLEGKSGDEAMAAMLTGLGSLSYGELAGERMKLGLLLHDPEEEHDCFSDNTHNSHYYNQVGIRALWEGHYTRTDGSEVKGPSLAALAALKAPEAAKVLSDRMAATSAAMQVMKDRADSGVEAYDQMIGEGNRDGNAVIQTAVDRLIAQARGIESVVAALGLTIKLEGSDSLDDPNSVQ